MPTKDPRWAHCVDSAPFGSNHGVECIVAFFGSDRVLFETDTPFDNKDGSHFIPVTISDVEGAVHDEAPRAALFKGNARKSSGSTPDQYRPYMTCGPVAKEGSTGTPESLLAPGAPSMGRDTAEGLMKPAASEWRQEASSAV